MTGQRFAAWALGVAVVGIAGCVSLKPEGRGVRVTANPELVRGCTYIGEVTGTTRYGPVGNTATDEQSAHNDLRNNAGRMGADTVLLQSTTGDNAIVKRGEAYRCGGVKPESKKAPS